MKKKKATSAGERSKGCVLEPNALKGVKQNCIIRTGTYQRRRSKLQLSWQRCTTYRARCFLHEDKRRPSLGIIISLAIYLGGIKEDNRLRDSKRQYLFEPY